MPLVSPWTWGSPDYQQNRISVTFTFDDITLVLLTCQVTRDSGCVYQSVYFGLGADGTPDTTPKVLANCQPGTTVFAPAVLTPVGLATISDVAALQVTAGPLWR